MSQDKKKYLQEYMQKSEYKEANRDRMRDSYYTPEGQEYEHERRRRPETRFGRGASNAKRRGREWTITLDEYKAIVLLPCHYCNSSIAEFTGHCLDRVDNDQGYHIDNVLPCCPTCNRIRHKSMSAEAFREQNKLNGRWKE